MTTAKPKTSLLTDIIATTEREARSQRAKAAHRRRKAEPKKPVEQFKRDLTRLTSTIAYAIRTCDVPGQVPGEGRMMNLDDLEDNARELANLLRDYRLGKYDQ